MKIATSAFKTYLSENDSVVICDLYTFDLVGIGTLRYADYPLAELVLPAGAFPDPNSLSHSSGGTFVRAPRFGRTKVSTKIGVEPAEVEISCYPAGPSETAETEDTIGNLSWQYFALSGGFDGAIVEIDRFFMPTSQSTLGGGDGFSGPLNTSLGSIIWFYGKMADVTIERSRITFKVKSLINVLQQQQMPRRIFQAGCTHIFGDTMCAYDRVNGKNALGVSTGIGATNVTAQSGSGQGGINISPGTSFNYSQGSCIGLTGENAGLTRGIQNNSPGTVVQFSRPFPFTVSVGDTFQLLPGCDHTTATCNSTFQNLLRFGGFPYIPPPEISI